MPKDSVEWRRVQQRLLRSLPVAELTRVERVHNPYTWRKFYSNCVTHHQEGRYHMDFTGEAGAVKELWHATEAIDAICESRIGL